MKQSSLAWQRDLVKLMRKEIVKSKSAVWKLMTNIIKEQLLPFQTQLSTINPLTAKADFDKEKHCERSSSSFANLIYYIRYHDPFLYVGIFKDELSRLVVLNALECNLLLSMRAFGEEYHINIDALLLVSYYDPALLTLLLLESINDRAISTQNFLSSFVRLYLLAHIYPNEKGFAFCLGNLMHLCSKEISSLIQAADASEISKYLSKQMKLSDDCCFVPVCKQIVDTWTLGRSLKQFQNESDIRDAALCYLKTSLGHTDFLEDSYSHILNAKVCLSNKDYEFATYWFVKSVESSTALYTTALSFKYLAKISFEIGCFVLSLRLLNAAYKCCNFYQYPIMPAFVNKVYFKKKRKIKKWIERMLCHYCHKKVPKLKCCTGCMKVTYCSKLCQKRGWKSSHRNECDGSWLVHYQILRDRFVFEL